MPAVLRSGDDQRKIQREDALISQEGRHIAVSNALRESLHDGGFAHTGFADQHGIILRATAENLDDALDFFFAPNQRIELAFEGGLSQVAAKFREERSFLRPIHLDLFSGTARQFFAQRRQTQSPLAKDLRAKTLFFAQDSQEEMLSAYVLMAKPFSLLGCVIEDALALLAERNFHRRGDALANRDTRLNLLADGLDGAMGAQKTIGQRLVFTHEAEQEVLGFDVRASVLTGLIAREEDHAAGLFRIAFKHG